MAENIELLNVDTYRVEIEKILAFENKAKNYIKDINADDGKSISEKEELKRAFRDEEKMIEEKKSAFLKSIEGRSIEELTEIVNILQSIYVEQKELKPFVKKLLVDNAFRKQIGCVRKADFWSCYSLIEFISDKFPVDEYAIYTLKPNPALYGAEVEKTAKGSLSLAPFSNDEIISTLEVFAEKNEWAFYNWIMAILSFDAGLMLSGFKDKYLKERQDLLLLIIDKLKKDEKYRSIVAAKLFEKGDLARIVNLQIEGKKSDIRVKELEQTVEDMKRAAEEREESYRERAAKQKEIIDEKESMLDSLRAKVKNYDEMSSKLTRALERYQAQVNMNEMLVIETDIKINEEIAKNKELTEDNNRIKTELINISAEYENVSSDLSLRITEIKCLKDSLSEVETKVKEKVLVELISSIKEQLYYISLFYLEIEENGTLEKDSLSMFGDTIQNINNGLKEIGVEAYGKIDETVEYDSSLHDPMGEVIRNGDKVLIRVPGWKILGHTYVKAQVEKEN